MNLQEAKQILKNTGYTLIREDAYMDAMDQELDDIRQDNIKSSNSITLTMPNISPEKLDHAFNQFKIGRANERACKALGRVCDLFSAIQLTELDKIKTLEPGKSFTFTNIPSHFGRFPMTRNHFLAYCHHYGDAVMETLIALACTKRNAIKLGV